VNAENLIIGQQLEELRTNGFTILKLKDIESVIEQVNDDVERLILDGSYKTNSKFYSYNDSPRIVESWKYSAAAKLLAFNTQIVSLLTEYFEALIKPFSTINFIRSTQQPLHSDYVHFGTDPAFHLAAAWVALEDIDPIAGPIQVVPGSHLWPEFLYSQIGLPIARSLSDVSGFYREYENWVRTELKLKQVQVQTPDMKKGDAIIWLANLLHGSPDCQNPMLSRRSQVTHYHTDQVELFYNPVFSDPLKGKFLKRKLEFIPN
jgi:ectoine hydroxylase-related dioxygenase (phytanoyl-CoA dioxygenase family)